MAPEQQPPPDQPTQQKVTQDESNFNSKGTKNPEKSTEPKEEEDQEAAGNKDKAEETDSEEAETVIPSDMEVDGDELVFVTQHWN